MLDPVWDLKRPLTPSCLTISLVSLQGPILGDSLPSRLWDSRMACGFDQVLADACRYFQVYTGMCRYVQVLTCSLHLTSSVGHSVREDQKAARKPEKPLAKIPRSSVLGLLISAYVFIFHFQFLLQLLFLFLPLPPHLLTPNPPATSF